MTKMHQHVIVLRCINPATNTDKEYTLEATYLAEVEEISDAMLIASYGKTGKGVQNDSKGLYTPALFEKILSEKIKKGYKIQSINGVLGTMTDNPIFVRRAFENLANSKFLDRTPQIAPAHIHVEFEIGQVSPIW